MEVKIQTHLDKYKVTIAEKVRELRTARRWNQQELAGHLGLSQNRLSEIERGGGSFSAEQLVLLLQLFNIGISEFVGEDEVADSQLQNALTRLGATHLRESENVVPSERLTEVNRVVVEVLIDGSARLITPLAPVLVANIDRIGLKRIDADLDRLGLENRLGWLVENVTEAIRQQFTDALSPAWRKRYQRALVLLDDFLESASDRRLQETHTDILDPTVRSSATLEKIVASRSAISERWNVVTDLKPSDFGEALRGAREGV